MFSFLFTTIISIFHHEPTVSLFVDIRIIFQRSEKLNKTLIQTENVEDKY